MVFDNIKEEDEVTTERNKITKEQNFSVEKSSDSSLKSSSSSYQNYTLKINIIKEISNNLIDENNYVSVNEN